MKKSTFLFCLLFVVSFGFTQTANLYLEQGPTFNTARMATVNTKLPDGKVLVVGGREPGFASSSTAEMFDPVANSFTQIQMLYPHDFSCLIKLDNGKFLIPGGSENLGVAPGYATAEIFDPSDNSFTTTGNMNYARCGLNGINIGSGKALLAGGWYSLNSASYAEVFDMNTNSFTATQALNTPRAYPVVLPANDGNAVVIGGYGYYGSPLYEQVELYNSENNNFSILYNNPIESETGWYTYSFLYSNNLETYRLNNGKYTLLFYSSSNDSLHYAIVFFNPETKSFSTLALSETIDMKGMGIIGLVVNNVNNLAYLPVVNYGTTPQELMLYAVDLSSGQVYKPGNSQPISSGIYVSSTSLTLLDNGKILIAGFTSANDYYTNFSAVSNTYILTPDVVQSVENLQNFSFNFSPNPAKDFLNIKLKDNRKSFAEIYNLTGEKMICTELNDINNKLDISNLPAGLYFIKLQNQNSTSCRKFVKN